MAVLFFAVLVFTVVLSDEMETTDLNLFESTDFEAFRSCDSLETCCSEESWNQSKCIEMLWKEHDIYVIISAVVLFVLCCCCCCCMQYRCRQKKETFKELDTVTNHYNVYI